MSKMIAPPTGLKVLTYKLIAEGVKRSDGAFIPESMGNRDWRKYQEWLAEGNTPDPQYTEQELIDEAQNEEISGLKTDLKNSQVWQFRMIVELFKAAKQKGLITNADIDPDVVAKAQQWVGKLDRLKEIDE